MTILIINDAVPATDAALIAKIQTAMDGVHSMNGAELLAAVPELQGLQRGEQIQAVTDAGFRVVDDGV